MEKKKKKKRVYLQGALRNIIVKVSLFHTF